MSRISTTFFGAAVLYALAGMVLGMYMGASNDHTLAPLHAHINLLGWSSLAVMGAFYGIAGDRTPVRLAWTNFAVSNLGNLITLPMLAQILTGKPANVPVISTGEMLIVIGMALFGLSILMVGRKAAAAAAA